MRTLGEVPFLCEGGRPSVRRRTHLKFQGGRRRRALDASPLLKTVAFLLLDDHFVRHFAHSIHTAGDLNRTVHLGLVVNEAAKLHFVLLRHY